MVGAENETRTRDPDLGKVVLYQLSYFRNNSLSKNYIHFVFGTSNGGAKLNYFFICANNHSVIFIFFGPQPGIVFLRFLTMPLLNCSLRTARIIASIKHYSYR